MRKSANKCTACIYYITQKKKSYFNKLPHFTGSYGAEDADTGRYEIDSDEDNLPFKCYICRNSFQDPIVTKCKHYFCEKCALAQYKKTTRCYVCNEQTHGVFNPAKDLVDKIKCETERRQAHNEGEDKEEKDDKDDKDDKEKERRGDDDDDDNDEQEED